MRRIEISLLGLIGLVVLFSAVTRADLIIATKFDPVFRINQIEKRCLVLKPGEVATNDALTGEVIMPDARDQRAYPYGSRVFTVAGGAAVIKFSPETKALLRSGGNVLVGEDKQDPNIKVLTPESGKMEFTVERGVEDIKNSIHVVTPCRAVILATNYCMFTVEVKKTSDRAITTINCTDGNIRVKHDDLFEIYLMALEKGKEQGIEIVSSLDNNFIRVQNERGTFGIKVRNPPDPEVRPDQPNEAIVDQVLEIFEGLTHEEGYKIWKLLPDMSAKFSQRKVEPGSFLLVTSLLATPDGVFHQEISYRYDKGQGKAMAVGEVTAPTPIGGDLDPSKAAKADAAAAPKADAGAGDALKAAPKADVPKADAPKADAPKAKAADDLLPLN